MTGYWVSFAIIALILPLGLINPKTISIKGKKITIEQVKIGNARLCYFIFFYLICDLFYMSCFIHSMVCQYIFGGIIMLIILMNVYRTVSFPKERTILEDFGILQDFLVGVGISIYLIYIIPNAGVREVTIPIVAAIYGGMITLVGVSLTIRKADRDRKEDELKKARPVFAYNMIRQEPKLRATMQKVCISDSSEQLMVACDVYVELENSNLSLFEIKRIYHDGTWIKMEGNTTVLPSSKCILNFRFMDNPLSLFLEIEDILGNAYYYQLFVLPLGTQSSNGMTFHTVREIKNISKENMEQIMKETK